MYIFSLAFEDYPKKDRQHSTLIGIVRLKDKRFAPGKVNLKGLSQEIDLKNVGKNLQNLA
jgi:hypothetical protein